jgi:hypothetical protein
MVVEVLTVAEIYARHPDEWVLVGEPQTSHVHQVQAGTVLAHSKDRDEVYRQAVALRPPRFAVLYAGELPPDTHVVL